MGESHPRRMVRVTVNGETLTHGNGDGVPGDWATLCGLDGEENPVEDALPGAKIDCRSCRMIFEAARVFRIRDFAPGLIGLSAASHSGRESSNHGGGE